MPENNANFLKTVNCFLKNDSEKSYIIPAIIKIRHIITKTAVEFRRFDLTKKVGARRGNDRISATSGPI